MKMRDIMFLGALCTHLLAFTSGAIAEDKSKYTVKDVNPHRQALTKKDYSVADRIFKSVKLRDSYGNKLTRKDLTREQQIMVVGTATRLNTLVAVTGGDEDLECDVWEWGIQCISWPYFCYIDVSSEGIDASCGNCKDPENGGCD